MASPGVVHAVGHRRAWAGAEERGDLPPGHEVMIARACIFYVRNHYGNRQGGRE
jgi:hypothetical protein